MPSIVQGAGAPAVNGTHVVLAFMWFTIEQRREVFNKSLDELFKDIRGGNWGESQG